MSPIVAAPIWSRLKPYLFVIDKGKESVSAIASTGSDRAPAGDRDNHVRIEFRDVPDRLSYDALCVVLPCITCGRPNHPLRRREGDGPDRIYYAPACPVGVRAACSRSAPAREEYERFREMDWARGKSTQLTLF